jgi:hypothetical protein
VQIPLPGNYTSFAGEVKWKEVCPKGDSERKKTGQVFCTIIPKTPREYCQDD